LISCEASVGFRLYTTLPQTLTIPHTRFHDISVYQLDFPTLPGSWSVITCGGRKTLLSFQQLANHIWWVVSLAYHYNTVKHLTVRNSYTFEHQSSAQSTAIVLTW